jgi:hypothetical protein
MTRRVSRAHDGRMRTTQISNAFVATIVTLMVSACGAGDASTTDHDSPPPGEAASGSQDEQITPGGIAVVILDHLGRDTVRQVITFTDEEEGEGVAVMVRLRDRTPHNFSVSVYPPEQAEDLGLAGKCPPTPQRKGESSQCRVLDDGTTVMTNQVAEGFSDDNLNGSLLMGTVITPEAGAVGAMYESYDDSPAISMGELEELLTDPRLTWFTDPEVNRAGEAVDLKEVTG